MLKQKLRDNKYYKIITKIHLCHRLPERTFNIKGHYFPVCSRCTGLTIGFLFSFVFFYFSNIHYSPNLLIFSVLIMLPTFIDGYTQSIGLRESNNALRLFTGLISGLGLALFIIIFFSLFGFQLPLQP
ncbi:DUF2085 domain-containing protein [Methanobacterium ferruginis]|uniref:DUF2085 domain-containing protein n=1 Tax=Methanobacterium ferruginis TaxID=710191 RepID=UPI002574571F|nr:DUF2085 domain-containing protein [Methanobacterium ferruginis]BDZ67381.1 hypothetical protein GCM10025860_08290 [Methanobacterium ferruginis]